MDTIDSRNDYQVCRLDADHLQDLYTLHNAVYGRLPGKGHFEGKYRTAYTGVEYIGYIAYAQNQTPVAFYGVIPCFLQTGDRRVLAAQSADTMTHPGYRLKGMFVELSRITFALCKEMGILLVFGFPNDNSYHGAVSRLGWRSSGVMHRFTIQVRTLPVRSWIHRLPRLEPLYKKYVAWVFRRLLEPAAGLPGTIRSEGFTGICRDDAYLRYKTYSPTHVLRIKEVLVWIRIREGLLLGDIQVDGRRLTAGDCRQVITGLKRLACRLGLPWISFITGQDTTAHRLFAGCYEAHPSYPVLVQDFGSGIAPGTLRFSFADIDVF